MKLRRVVITGMGAVTPIGNDLGGYWKGLSNGVSGAAPITKFDATNFKTKFACELKDLNINDHIDRKEARKMDAFSHYAVIACEEAINDAGIKEGVDKNRIGVILGTGIGGLRSFQDEVTDFARGNGIPRFNPFFIPKMIGDLAPGHVSIRHGFRGPNFATVSACASSSNAIIDAYNYIRLGHAELFVTGGSEAAVTEAGVGGFNALKALSERNDSPETASRPFDKERNGFVLGEGAGSLILEEYEHAKARGAHIYAEIIGTGMSADAYHITAPHPEGAGIELVMRNAIKDAGIALEEVDYINVHGTSTPLGDVGEAKAIQSVFGDHAYSLNISSTKSMTGHLLGGAGAIETIAGVLSIKHQLVPPTINHFTDDEALDTRLNFTFNKAQSRKIETVISNTFGFGGHNTSIVLKKFEN